MPKEKQMQDGTTAYLSDSGRYYIRREPYPKWKRISYYTLEGKKVQLAEGKCKKCKKIIKSLHCGHYVICSCGESFVDTDRWTPERHRYGGEIEPANKSDKVEPIYLDPKLSKKVKELNKLAGEEIQIYDVTITTNE